MQDRCSLATTCFSFQGRKGRKRVVHDDEDVVEDSLAALPAAAAPAAANEFDPEDDGADLDCAAAALQKLNLEDHVDDDSDAAVDISGKPSGSSSGSEVMCLTLADSRDPNCNKNNDAARRGVGRRQPRRSTRGRRRTTENVCNNDKKSLIVIVSSSSPSSSSSSLEESEDESSVGSEEHDGGCQNIQSSDEDPEVVVLSSEESGGSSEGADDDNEDHEAACDNSDNTHLQKNENHSPRVARGADREFGAISSSESDSAAEFFTPPSHGVNPPNPLSNPSPWRSAAHNSGGDNEIMQGAAVTTESKSRHGRGSFGLSLQQRLCFARGESCLVQLPEKEGREEEDVVWQANDKKADHSEGGGWRRSYDDNDYTPQIRAANNGNGEQDRKKDAAAGPHRLSPSTAETDGKENQAKPTSQRSLDMSRRDTPHNLLKRSGPFSIPRQTSYTSSDELHNSQRPIGKVSVGAPAFPILTSEGANGTSLLKTPPRVLTSLLSEPEDSGSGDSQAAKKAIGLKSPPTPSGTAADCSLTTPPTTKGRTPKKLVARQREELARTWYATFNAEVFGDKLPKDLKIEWNQRLTRTAGQTIFMKRRQPLGNGRSSSEQTKIRVRTSTDNDTIAADDVWSDSNPSRDCWQWLLSDEESTPLDLADSCTQLAPKTPPPPRHLSSCAIHLSVKVLDCEYRLSKTLLHECCHVAQFLIEGETRPPHGAGFTKWAQRATAKYPHLRVTTCHNYDIHYPHKWECEKCGHVYGRHSKSIDISRQCCGKASCSGRLKYMGAFAADGTPKRPRTATPYNRFVKEHYREVQRLNPTSTTSEIMKLLSTQWKSVKETTGSTERHG